jgi:hypothetical protein
MDVVLLSSVPLSAGLTVAAAGFGLLVAAILPTCLYLYVEPRGRMSWGVLGDTPATRRAPAIVRAAAWSSFAVGQLAIPALIVPLSCVALLYLQTKLGVLRPAGALATLVVAVAATAQSLLALRLLPLGVRLLARDPRPTGRAGGVARVNALGSGAILGICVAIGTAMAGVPGLVHPWLRTALDWAGVRPLGAFATVCLLQALLVGSSTRVPVEKSPNER